MVELREPIRRFFHVLLSSIFANHSHWGTLGATEIGMRGVLGVRSPSSISNLFGNVGLCKVFLNLGRKQVKVECRPLMLGFLVLLLASMVNGMNLLVLACNFPRGAMPPHSHYF